MFQGLAVKQAPNTGSPDRTGAGSSLRCAPPPSGMLREGYPTGRMCYATARAQARPSTSSGQALPEMRDNRGESPTRPCPLPPAPLRGASGDLRGGLRRATLPIFFENGEGEPAAAAEPIS
jgi:hypothetical protein